ncbi:uncharacterized protein GGS22DRAFT_46296 [Annulohypoxylon maeteangense]|uniref:uncharacterized protein n=1 Tax=Annulohypoxylon maeteangense TaxID=1927788 RepID=UPI002008031A|nr:uncharacterized protein GGS22DRAFT_46296 [Annulohypoxylon maeteangense]KAI0882562.1 hypothetical protein GGS22DRAFT_46296 [Annulohypoxylon maeteangense]
MNHITTSFTPLETFALFQELNRNFQSGLVIGTFSHISDTLKKTPVIYEQDGYDANRLSPDSLQGIALQLLRDEKRREVEATIEKNNAALSPTSKKRKLQSPPLSTFPESLDHTEKLPILVEKLYIRFRDSLIREIREDEKRFEELQRELIEIERGEWDSKFSQEQRVDLNKNGVPSTNDSVRTRPEGQLAVAPPPIPPSTPASVATFTPVPTPAPIPTPTPVPTLPKVHDPVRKSEPPHIPHPPQERTTIHPIPSSLPSTARPSNEARHVTPDNRSQELGRPIGGPIAVLQHPQAVQGYTARPGSATPQPPVTDGLQRPEGIPKGRSPAPTPSNQPHISSPTPTPTSAPVPASASTAAPLKWEPLYQPPHQPSQPFQSTHQVSHQPQLPPGTPSPQHQLPHQTPVPSPRPPYNAGVTRPPSYPSQAPTALPQFPQNYSGGRQTPGQYGQQSRPPIQGSTPTSPSVLLPPQNSGQIPPSLQSLPLNAAPDGMGQQAPQRRPASVPVATSPNPNMASGPYPQHRGQHVPTQTPVRPPVALSAVHPAVGSAKPPVPPAQWAHSPGPAQPNYAPQSPAPTTPAPQQDQPQPALKLYSSPYNPQAQPASTTEQPQRPQVPPLQTPASTSQPIRPSSITQLQTPIALSPHVIRGHGTKWTSTPTPATPRMEDGTSYFDLDSPMFEPISPPSQPAQLPKTSPEQAETKDMRKPIQKFDGSASRPRGRPRILQKPTPLVQSEEASAEQNIPGSDIKNEEATPRALEDIGDAVAVEENVQNQVPPQLEPSQPSNKRKRQDSPPNRASPTPATHVLWTRSFNKISQSALDQIISHRHANMFAHPVKPRTAPGYFEIVLRPQDLKGIQKAITAGSKAAAAAVATMSDIEASATNVWIPISVDLVPPRGIINIAQLERELVHMFANAIMYNPDPYRGFGPSFLRSNRRANQEDDGEDYRGYEVDENGVVKDTRSMFGEVEKLLSDLRNEVERNAPPPTGVPPSVSRSLSVAGGENNTVEDEADEQAGDANKRRRIRG